MRFAKTTIVHFISQIGKSIAGFVVVLYLARVLGSNTLGKYFVVIALMSWLTIPVNGVLTGVTKRVSEGKNQEEFLTAGFILNVLVVIFTSTFLHLFQSVVRKYIGAPVIYLLIALILVQSMFMHMSAGFNGQKMVAKAGLAQFFERTLRGGSQVLLVYLGHELGGVIAGHIVSLLIVAIFGYRFYDIGFSIPTSDHFRSLLSFSKYSWLGSVKSSTFGWMDIIILNFFVASSFIAVYEVAWRLASFLIVLSISITQTVFPEISEMSSDKKYDSIHNLINEALAFSGLLVIPGFVGAMILGPELLKIYGSDFTQGSLILLILIVGRGLGAYENTLTQTINAINRPKIAFRVNFVFISSNLILNVVLIYSFGWYGAAVATTISMAITLIMAYWSISKIIGKPRIPFSEILKQILSSVLMGIVILFLSDLGSSTRYTIFLIFLGSVFYGVCIVGISKRLRRKLQSLVL